MTDRSLLIPARALTRTDLAESEFVWRPHQSETSFLTNLEPDLASIGEVPDSNADLLSVALVAFLADRTIRRPGKGWARSVDLTLPVYNAAVWESTAEATTGLLEMLTGDQWTVTFRERRQRRSADPTERPSADRVLLFSGGADSLCGAVRALEAGDRVILVSHWDWPGHSQYQSDLTARLESRYPGQVLHRQHRVGRRGKQILSGARFGDEPTRRSRSLLFLALGLAYAAVDPSLPLWIAENGYAALNPPLAGERRGALSTRTTHPAVLDGVAILASTAGGHADLSNPFETMTKGEMYREVRDAIGADAASELLSASHSCSHVRWAIGTGLPPATQCGVCFGCLVRRSAFLAADVPDETLYIHTAIAHDQLQPWMQAAAHREIETVRYAGLRGVRPVDLLAIGLPDRVDVDEAVAVAQRGLNELTSCVDTLPDLDTTA